MERSWDSGNLCIGVALKYLNCWFGGCEAGGGGLGNVELLSGPVDLFDRGFDCCEFALPGSARLKSLPGSPSNWAEVVVWTKSLSREGSLRDRSTGIGRVAIGKAWVMERSNQVQPSRIGGYMTVVDYLLL